MNDKTTRVDTDATLSYGGSLPGHFYSDAAIFAADLGFLCDTQWMLIDHASRIPNPGDYFLFAVGKENLIIIRDRENAVHAFYNVCRHRGSRICREKDGHVNLLVCPYHSWSYALEGQLRGAASMADNFEKSRYSLRSAHLRVEQGFIFINLATAQPPDFGQFIDRTLPFLAPHGFETARIATRKTYPTDANWKLVVENFLECYHCKAAHQTFCSVHSSEKLLAYGAGPGSASHELATQFSSQLVTWEREAAAKGFFTGMFADDWHAPYFQSASRLPIGHGYATESVGGVPMAPLMGDYTQYDYAQTAITLNPISHVLSSSDHAIAFRFTPRGPLTTDVEAIWLVRDSAVEGTDYDIAKLMRVWDVTLSEDKVITEDNQAGVLSTAYTPGPHSRHEARITDFCAWYAEHRGVPINT